MANTPAMTTSSRVIPQPPKSILKKPSATASGTLQAPKSAKVQAPTKSSQKRNPSTNKITVSQGKLGPNGRRLPTPEEAREIALYHANLIQSQKNLELSILESVEMLLDFPTTKNPASKPSEADINEFKKNLIHFRPSDYDDLIEERNIIHKCGYPLCPMPNKLQPTKAKFRVLDKGRRIVETKQLERFCGDECARRGLWIRVQLNEQPSWQRIGADGEVGQGGTEYRITLLEEVKKEQRDTVDNSYKGDVKKLADQLQNMGISGTGLSTSNGKHAAQTGTSPSVNGVATDRLEDQLQSLSISGADFTSQPQKPKVKELVSITERITGSPNYATPPQIPTLSPGSTDDDELVARMTAMAVEGYTPKGPNKDLASKWKETVASRKKNRHGDDENDDDNNEK